MEYKSFCLETNNCKNDSGEYTLGSASPVAFHTFDPVYARELGLDPNYSYPSALARQYIPHGDLPDHDISIRMNSDVNWAFAGANLNESFMDFKQIFLHETLHGLGILTSWSSETIPGMILPGSFKYENRAITGFQESGIFDKFMFDQVTRVWLSTYAAAIRADANIVSSRLNTRDKLAWTREFRKTQGARLAELLFSKAMVLPNAITMWINLTHDPIVMFTPVRFDSGSSMSHLDNEVYFGSADYVLRRYYVFKLKRNSKGTSNVITERYNPVDERYGTIGEIATRILESMGYVTRRKGRK